MHIPDGFLSPQTFLPAYAVAAAAWAYGARRLRAELDERTLPWLAALTAFSFVLMLILVPLPGGTTAHASGIAVLAVLAGVWTAFLCISLVLVLQALLLGDGGVTALPLNALAMGLAGSAAAVLAYRGLRRFGERAALFAAGWLAVNVSAALLALALGVQPLIAAAEDGTPRFFPFGLAITLPAVMVPHAMIGIGEGLLTVALVRLARRYVPQAAS